jgi:hypothetical protein
MWMMTYFYAWCMGLYMWGRGYVMRVEHIFE